MENIQVVPSMRASRAWLESLRLRTLPLAFASIINGSALAYWLGRIDLKVALLTLLTTSLLQILSNLANDYGDALKGSDTTERIGPLRGMQKGAISIDQMRGALVLMVLLTLFSGIALIVLACDNLQDVMVFIGLGALAIVAAIAYTVGKKPYGYRGLGDISVMIFFGLLGVSGSQYLQTHSFHNITLLPAMACGLLAAAVLNVNNMRDIDTDRQHGKYTLATRLGAINARRYHALLLSGALFCFGLFAFLAQTGPAGWLFLLASPLLYRQARHILLETSTVAMRPMLEKTVKTALLSNLLFATGLVLS
ncbi:1,4-dihydroxy-2-naphthoate octaprenyltransferase [[Pantoea] beijingensis]|uniref:1,4-dihydroxy-2-naphthoate octaprenyltransferase n=1 Tax=[Pantoea] beijingensis TaxID=1324864 RepID=A0A443IGM5_9GAMM|nr:MULTISPECIES: 1,4-dihydroxy-2-naphthoate polyprenyltransferase [Erwiniaceae]RWR03227.1 1,4-dihydroxy-2-naphthoate octaprenyltransferase [[Pantoea] beijingensis]